MSVPLHFLCKGQVASNTLHEINQLVQLKEERTHAKRKGERETGDVISLLSLFETQQAKKKKERSGTISFKQIL
jgi:hypothetical protein